MILIKGKPSLKQIVISSRKEIDNVQLFKMQPHPHWKNIYPSQPKKNLQTSIFIKFHQNKNVNQQNRTTTKNIHIKKVHFHKFFQNGKKNWWLITWTFVRPFIYGSFCMYSHRGEGGHTFSHIFPKWKKTDLNTFIFVSTSRI